VHYTQFVRHIKKHGFDNLPGQEAQLMMAPNIRKEEIRNMGMGKGPVKSSVLILVYPGSNEKACTAFIRRPKYDGVHSGQIAFPGGRYEESDGNVMKTALREAQEEIGIDSTQVEMAGRLTDLYIPPSNYLVSPFVGLMHTRPAFVPDKKEVEQIIEIPLCVFRDDEYLTKIPITMATGESLETPCYLVDEHTIWGATAMIMAEFVAVVRSLM